MDIAEETGNEELEGLLHSAISQRISQVCKTPVTSIDSLIERANNATTETFRAFELVMKDIELKLAELKRLEELQKIIKEHAERAPSVVKLNVRGKVFQIYRSGLERIEGNYFQLMLASEEWQPEEDGAYFIDRPYEAFERILLYLSDGLLSYEGLNSFESRILKENLDYFKLRPK